MMHFSLADKTKTHNKCKISKENLSTLAFKILEAGCRYIIKSFCKLIQKFKSVSDDKQDLEINDPMTSRPFTFVQHPIVCLRKSQLMTKLNFLHNIIMTNVASTRQI